MCTCAVRVARAPRSKSAAGLPQTTLIVVGIVSSAVGVVLLGFLIAFLLYKKRRNEYDSEEFGSTSSSAQQPFHSGVPPGLFHFCSFWGARLLCVALIHSKLSRTGFSFCCTTKNWPAAPPAHIVDGTPSGCVLLCVMLFARPSSPMCVCWLVG